jgi:XTP/dITP diphosphohydrolase
VTAFPGLWVFASQNPGKLAEAGALLAESGIALRPQAAVGVEPIPETGQSFVENALLKARHASRVSKLPAIADDSGLCVDALGGAPGLHSARYAGAEATDAGNIAKLLAALRGRPAADRTAHFVCVLVALRAPDDPDPLIATARWYGAIAPQRSGIGGFGYDPVFYVPTEGRTAAELNPARKSALSHRGQAFAALSAALRAQQGPTS